MKGVSRMKRKLVEIAEFPEYDPKRFGRPWLAKLKGVPGTTKLNYEFQDAAFVGDAVNGGKIMGYLEDGDYISYGQKDFKGNATVQWTGVYLEGELKPVSKSEIVTDLCNREEQDF